MKEGIERFDEQRESGTAGALDCWSKFGFFGLVGWLAIEKEISRFPLPG